jgi:hypothetical protein
MLSFGVAEASGAILLSLKIECRRLLSLRGGVEVVMMLQRKVKRDGGALRL